MSSNMDARCNNDYQFWDYPTVMAAVYIGLSATSLVLNIALITIVFTSKRIQESPKYWVVVVISLTFIFQSGVTNNMLAVEWLKGEETVGKLWKMCILFNRYIATGIASWGSFIINLDFAMSMKSAAYTRNYRVKFILFLMFLTWGPMIAAVVIIPALKDTSIINTAMFIDTDSQKILLWVTLFAPLAVNVLCCPIMLIWRCSSKLQNKTAENVDISKHVDTGDCPYLPPSDHLTLFLILVMFYVPNAILTYEPLWPEECPSILTFLSICTALRDNTGCIAPLVWFLFKDVRIALRMCLARRGRMSGSLDSQMHTYDIYPYCTRIQV